MLVVATTCPLPFVESTPLVMPVRYTLPETVSAVLDAYVVLKLVAQPVVMVAREEEAFAKFWRPVQVLASVSSVELAALMTILLVPLKETPLMVRALWRAVAVPALPEIEAVMVLL